MLRVGEVAVLTLAKFDHIAIVVPDLDQALSHFKLIFDIDDRDVIYHRDYRDVDPETGEADVHHFAFFPVGETYLELTQPVSDGALKDFLVRTGGGVHHVGLTSDDIAGDWSKHRAQRHELGLIDSRPRIDQYGVSYWFLHPKRNHRVLLEVDAAWTKTSASQMTPIESVSSDVPE
jgi:methylmalonyl-CoA epimerase